MKLSHGWSISTFLSFLITIVVAIITISLAGYVSYFAKGMALNNQTYIEDLNSSMASLFDKMFAQDYKTGNYEKTKIVIDNLEENNMLAYVFVTDKENTRVIWTNNPAFINIPTSEMHYIIRMNVNPEGKKIDERKWSSNNYNILLGFSSTNVVKASKAPDDTLVSFLKYLLKDRTPETLLIHLQVLMALFLIAGGCASVVIISLTINKPLSTLIKGVGELAGGNLKFRLEKARYTEINNLVESYNYMAFQLNELYESLELKVQERTVELEQANSNLKDAQVMMVHSEKMRSLGELVAGIAHEINNPVNFIHGNLSHLQNYSQDMLTLIEMYTKLESTLPAEKKQEIDKYKKEIDLEFLKDDIKDLIKSCKDGTERTKNIVLDLKNFSRLGDVVLTELDIPKEIDTTLNILNNKIKDRITIHKEFDPDLPKIEAYGGQLNQVFMNILDNAQYAIKGVGDIFISASCEGDKIKISFKDTGAGMSEDDLAKVFEPFYTTKPVGEGTGMGMSIAYKVIQNHRGDVKIESEPGVGTTLTLTLPITHPEQEQINNGHDGTTKVVAQVLLGENNA